jgi:hypothetical protein
MFRLPQHVEYELQAFLELLCPSAIVLKSQMFEESIEISSILVKEEKIELLDKVKEEIIELPNKGKDETKELQSKGKENIVLQIVKEETLELSKTNNHQDKSIITYIDNIYKESFNKFIYFRWIAKSIVLVLGKSAKIVGHRRFPRARAQHTIRYIPTSCLTTIDEDLD